MAANPVSTLTALVAAVCPIDGTRMGDPNDRSTWSIDFRPEATDEQRSAAATVLATFDPVVPTPGEVDDERDRRIALPLMVTLANPTRKFQVNMDGDALRNMNGLATGAVLAKMLQSSLPTNFIAYDNSVQSLSPDDLVSMGLQVQAQISKMTFAARTLKDTSPIPADYANDAHWA